MALQDALAHTFCVSMPLHAPAALPESPASSYLLGYLLLVLQCSAQAVSPLDHLPPTTPKAKYCPI